MSCERIQRDAEPSAGHLRDRRGGTPHRGRRAQGRRVRLRGQGRSGRVHSLAVCRDPRPRSKDAAAPREGSSRNGSARGARPVRGARRAARDHAARGQSSRRQQPAADRVAARPARPSSPSQDVSAAFPTPPDGSRRSRRCIGGSTPPTTCSWCRSISTSPAWSRICARSPEATSSPQLTLAADR